MKLPEGVRNFPKDIPITLVHVEDGWKAMTVFQSQRGKQYVCNTFMKTPDEAINEIYKEVHSMLNRESPIHLMN